MIKHTVKYNQHFDCSIAFKYKYFISIISFNSTNIILEVTIFIAWSLFKVMFTNTDKLSSNKLTQHKKQQQSKAKIKRESDDECVQVKIQSQQFYSFELRLAHTN